MRLRHAVPLYFEAKSPARSSSSHSSSYRVLFGRVWSRLVCKDIETRDKGCGKNVEGWTGELGADFAVFSVKSVTLSIGISLKGCAAVNTVDDLTRRTCWLLSLGWSIPRRLSFARQLCRVHELFFFGYPYEVCACRHTTPTRFKLNQLSLKLYSKHTIFFKTHWHDFFISKPRWRAFSVSTMNGLANLIHSKNDWSFEPVYRCTYLHIVLRPFWSLLKSSSLQKRRYKG